MDETISVPTVLDAIDTVNAVNKVKIKLIVLTGTPLILAAFSSIVLYIEAIHRAILTH